MLKLIDSKNDLYAKNICLALFFLSLLMIGIYIYQDYGLSWDEPTERLTGLVNLNYIGEFFNFEFIKNSPMIQSIKDIRLQNYSDRVFGPAFPIITSLIEILIGRNELYIGYRIRHFITYLVFLMAVFTLYKIAEMRFKDWKFALFIALLLILSPRFFGESFFNSKDIVFLAFFNLSIYTLLITSNNFSVKNILLHSLTTAIAIDIRSIGFILILISLTVFAIKNTRIILKPKGLAKCGVYLFATFMLTILFWPWLWEKPLPRLIEGITIFSKWITQIQIFYLGNLISIQKEPIPWHYILVWIGITTPLIYLLFWIIGIIKTTLQLIKSPFEIWSNNELTMDLIFTGICIFPIVGIIFLHSIIYDGWRHLYFIYPSFLLLCGKGIQTSWELLKNFNRAKVIFIGGVGFCLSLTFSSMIRNHPHQNIYFNALAGKNLIENFDVDYWGLSNKQALEWIAANDNRPQISVGAGSIMALEYSMMILPPEIKDRFIFTSEITSSDYVISNYRGNLTKYDLSPFNFIRAFEILIDNEIILSIYQNPISTKNLNEITRKNFIEFSKEGNGTKMLGLGWGYPEDWGTWMVSKNSLIVIPVNQEEYPSSLTLNLRPFVTENSPTQKIKFYINGKFIKEVVFNKNFNFPVDLKIPKTISKTNIVVLVKAVNPVRPSDFGPSDDSRSLSIGLVSLMIN